MTEVTSVQALQLWSWYCDFPDGSDGEASACNAGDLGSISGSGRSPGEGKGSILAWRIPWMKEPGEL